MIRTLDTPIGTLAVEVRDGALRAVHFEPPAGADDPAAGSAGHGADDEVAAAAVAQLREYFAGDRVDFDLPLAPAGTDFQHRVWERLRAIPHGETSSYGRLAANLGLTGHGARAVGLANGRNPIPVVVPCHRVVGADGRLVGYAGGVERKAWLLQHEGAGGLLPSPPFAREPHRR